MMTTRLMATLVLLQTWLTPPTRRDERGSVSVEQAVITGAVVLIAALVVAALNAFVQGKLVVLGG